MTKNPNPGIFFRRGGGEEKGGGGGGERLSFLYVTHCHDLFYITVKYHDYISMGIQVMERTQNCI